MVLFSAHITSGKFHAHELALHATLLRCVPPVGAEATASDLLDDLSKLLWRLLHEPVCAVG